MKKIIIITYFIIFIILTPFTVHSKSSEEARIKLGQMNIPYTIEAFGKSLMNHDTFVTMLFIDSGYKISKENLKKMSGDYNFQPGYTPNIADIALIEWADDDGWLTKETIKKLLDRGADINGPDGIKGLTPLVCALCSGSNRHESIQLLIDNSYVLQYLTPIESQII